MTQPKSLLPSDLLQLHCKASGCWGLLLRLPDWSEPITKLNMSSEVRKAAPYLQGDWSVWPGDTVFFFGTRKEIEGMFWQTVGEDGPTKTNSYNGPARVYAVTSDDRGNLQHENT